MADLPATANTGQETRIREEDLDKLVASLRGRMIRPGDDGYEEARKVHNGLIDKRPGLIVVCAGVADVIESVNFARTNDLLVAVRGGGHNVAGTGVCDGGILVDLSQMRGIRVDPERRLASAQGGATWGDITHETQAFGLATPGGGVSSTGVAGSTLGGGMGLLQRKYGLSCDNLESVDLVTADGRFLTASRTMNEDLFWAVRGGGGNFGVATSLEYRIHPIGPTVMIASPMYAAAKAGEALRAWRDFVSKAPDEVTSVALFSNVPSVPTLPEDIQGAPVLTIAACYAGPIEEAERVLQPLREFDVPVVDFTAPVPYMAIISGSDALFPKGDYYYWKSAFLDSLSDQIIDALVARGVDRPSPRSMVELWHLGGAISRVGSAETAFGNRDAPFMLNISSIWGNPGDSDRNVEWTRELWAYMRRFSRAGLYLNFAGFGEEGDDLVRAAYGMPNYERLVALKNKYDPTNLFRTNRNIKPAS